MDPISTGDLDALNARGNKGHCALAGGGDEQKFVRINARPVIQTDHKSGIRRAGAFVPV